MLYARCCNSQPSSFQSCSEISKASALGSLRSHSAGGSSAEAGSPADAVSSPTHRDGASTGRSLGLSLHIYSGQAVRKQPSGACLASGAALDTCTGECLGQAQLSLCPRRRQRGILEQKPWSSAPAASAWRCAFLGGPLAVGKPSVRPVTVLGPKEGQEGDLERKLTHVLRGSAWQPDRPGEGFDPEVCVCRG